LFIIGFALFMGLSLPAYFAKTPLTIDSAPWLADVIMSIGKSGMSVGAITAFVLDNTVAGTDKERGLLAWRQGKTEGEVDAELTSPAVPAE
jgi:nucleobase transporter 1/2